MLTLTLALAAAEELAPVEFKARGADGTWHRQPTGAGEVRGPGQRGADREMPLDLSFEARA